MPIPLKIALDLFAEDCIKISPSNPVTARDIVLRAKLDPCNSRRLSRMEALQGRAKAKATQFLNEQDLVRIEQAFHRMETGNFGYCVKCDAKIPLTQLEQDPTKTCCPDCDKSTTKEELD